MKAKDCLACTAWAQYQGDLVEDWGDCKCPKPEDELKHLRQVAREFGCVVVPMEPTEDIIEAASLESDKHITTTFEQRRWLDNIHSCLYKAMIQAAEAADGQ